MKAAQRSAVSCSETHFCHPPHRVLVVNAYGEWQSFITATIELAVLLAAFKRFGRLSLEEFTGIPFLPPLNLSLESSEICLVNNYQVQIARPRIRITAYRCPDLRLWGDTEADVAAAAHDKQISEGGPPSDRPRLPRSRSIGRTPKMRTGFQSSSIDSQVAAGRTSQGRTAIWVSRSRARVCQTPWPAVASLTTTSG